MANQDLSTADAPEHVARILRNAAQAMAEAQGDLESAWQDPQAGKIWADFARILNRAATSCDNAMARRGL